MAFHSIAYGEGDLCLLTIDGNELLAYDAQSESPRWRVAFAQPLAGVLYVDPAAFPARQAGGNPFRSQSAAARVALVVDQESRLHLLDTTLGQSIGDVDPPNGPTKPYALATSASGAVALATEDALHLWRSGERIQMPGVRSRAIAFSNDGKTLAVGTDRGELRMYSVSADTKAALEETYKAKISGTIGSISDLHQHPNGDWVVAGSNGASLVNAAGPSRLEKIPDILRVRFDAIGRRLAVQRSDRGIVVYEWPSLNVMMRVEYTDRPVRGLAFGPENWLGVALDHGDGNKIDVVTSSVHRTDTHPGRQHRSWTLMVEGKKEILSAKEAEDIRRMKSSFEEVKPASSGSGYGGRIGIGAMISIALIAVRVCVRASSPSPSYSSFNFPTTMPFPKSCDKACAIERLQSLKRECAALTPSCEKDAQAAEDAINVGECSDAKAAIERIPTTAGTAPDGTSKAPLFGSTRLLASLGVNEACSMGGLRLAVPRAPKRMNLTHVRAGVGKDAKPVTTTERIFEDSPGDYETAEGMYVAPDATMFIVAKTKTNRLVVHRRVTPTPSSLPSPAPSASWETAYTKQGSNGRPFIFGRSAKDVWISDSVTLLHYDGQGWSTISTPVAGVHRMAGTAGDTFMLGGGFSSANSPINLDLYKRKGTSWAMESIAPFRRIENVFANPSGNALFAFAFDPGSGHDTLLQRTGGVWQARRPPPAATTGDAGATDDDDTDGEPELRSAWVSPNGDAFVTTSQNLVLRISANGTVTRTTTDGSVSAIWGRSSTDVYAVTFGSIQHFDGKKWTTALDWPGTTPDVISGNSSEVLLLVNTEY